MTREESKELIDMLTIIKGQAIKSNNDTAIINIKIDSFNFVVDKAIKAIEQEPKIYINGDMSANNTIKH